MVGVGVVKAFAESVDEDSGVRGVEFDLRVGAIVVIDRQEDAANGVFTFARGVLAFLLRHSTVRVDQLPGQSQPPKQASRIDIRHCSSRFPARPCPENHHPDHQVFRIGPSLDRHRPADRTYLYRKILRSCQQLHNQPLPRARCHRCQQLSWSLPWCLPSDWIFLTNRHQVKGRCAHPLRWCHYSCSCAACDLCSPGYVLVHSECHVGCSHHSRCG